MKARDRFSIGDWVGFAYNDEAGEGEVIAFGSGETEECVLIKVTLYNRTVEILINSQWCYPLHRRPNNANPKNGHLRVVSSDG
ncbi:hypothetical protein [Methylorubrum populi]|uniref:hypothetical protein n=1 Tax=Methylorubrum populi TaxID=223967 RepID=UPI0012655754|nr:hypothetical protein [Methylorubrum populi]